MLPFKIKSEIVNHFRYSVRRFGQNFSPSQQTLIKRNNTGGKNVDIYPRLEWDSKAWS